LTDFKNGWERYGAQQSVKKETLWLPAVCPKVGWMMSSNTGVEVSAILGKSMGGSIALTLTF
jgi:hypothetical protein